ncbi:MAG: chromate transporter [Clostridia bacterium]|nr:chromate transporter [Clostridia bacterium]MDY4083507.1 chromate transporter [Eubacteriales bacterium]
MSIYLQLFLTFLKIGAVSFGGGYAMISLVRETCIANGWLTEEEILNFIAVSESTPGPIAINMATFVGSSQGGILGSFLATLGVVLPSFVIILLVAAVMRNVLKYAGVNRTVKSVQPAIVAMILSTALTMFLSNVFNLSNIHSTFEFDWKSLIIFAIVAIVAVVYKKLRKKNISAILLIVLSAIMGMLFFGIK